MLLPAPSPATLLQYHVSVLGLRIIDVSLIILLGVIWYLGFYGYARLKTYAQLIHGNKDGKQVMKLTRGVLLVVLWLPISTTVSSVLSFIAMKHPGFLPASIIISNYVSLSIPFLGFIIINAAVRKLNIMAGQYPPARATNLIVLLLIYVGLIYYHFVASTQNRSLVYHMPIWVILTTLAAPYMYMWFMGMQAVYDLSQYRRKAPGIVYRRSWARLGLGLGWLLVLSISFQYLSTLGAHLAHLSIYWLLAVIYSILLVLAVGFLFIADGARKLQKIEEV
jgi:hypothetical protein